MPALPLDDLILLLLAQIAVIVTVSRLLGLAFRALGQPQVIGEVLAGIFLGPSLFGALAPGVSADLFPASSLPFLKVLSEFGIVFFMFLIGLELDPGLLRGRGRVAALISGTSIVFPFALGIWVAFTFHAGLAPEGIPPLNSALFLGTAMSITAFPVLARILVERDLLGTPVGAMTLTCAAVDDIVGWCLLAIVVAMAGSAHAATGALVLGKFLLYAAFMVGVIRPILRRIQTLYEARGGLSQNLFSLLIVLVLLSAWTTQWIGIHAIFGGFLIGAIMPKHDRFVQDVVDRTEDFVTVFLLPVYFAYTGLRTQIGLLDTSTEWMFCALLTGVAVAGKFGGSFVAARVAGFGMRDAGTIGALMNTRGLMELVVLNVGLDLGVITPTVFAMMVLMAIFTTVIAAPVVSLLRRGEPEGIDRSAPQAGVLIPIALATSGPRLFDMAIALQGGMRPRVYAVHISRPAERGVLGASPAVRSPRDENVFDPILKHAAHSDVDLNLVSLVSRNPADDIASVARTNRVDLVLMGWHKPIFGRSVLGGTVDRVMNTSPVDVAVFIDKGLPDTVHNILLPYTGSKHDQRALSLATRLATHFHADVTVLHVVRPGRTNPHIESELRAMLDGGGIDPMTGGHTRFVVEESTQAVQAVINHARTHDLTVLGVGEEWEVEPSVFGMRSQRIATECKSSLLIVRAA